MDELLKQIFDIVYKLKIGLSRADKEAMVAYIYNKLVNQTGGGIKGFYDTTAEILALKSNQGLLVARDTLSIYYWNGVSYELGSPFQPQGIENGQIITKLIADGAVTPEKTNFLDFYQYGVNIFNDKQPMLVDQALNNLGVLESKKNFSTTENFINVERFRGQKVYPLGIARAVCQYDELGNFIEGKLYIDQNGFDITPTTTYIKMTIATSTIKNYMLQGGTKPTGYIPFNDLYKLSDSIYVPINEIIEIINNKMGAFNESVLKSLWLGTTKTDYEIKDNFYLGEKGQEFAASNYEINYLTPSFDIGGRTIEIGTYLGQNIYICTFDKDNKFLQSFTNAGSVPPVYKKFIIDLHPDAVKIGISMAKKFNATPTAQLYLFSTKNVKDLVAAQKDTSFKLEPNGGAFRIFHDIGVIGDSLASGEFEYSKPEGGTGYIDTYPYSWGQCIKRAMGVEVTNYSEGGQTAKTIILSKSPNITPLWESKKQCYIVGLGTNDHFHIDEYSKGWGNVDTDIDLNNYNNNADSFVGWYARIIQRVREKMPDCFFFFLPNPTILDDNQLQAIKDLAIKFKRCYVVDTSPYTNEWKIDLKLGFHLDPYGYQLYGDYVMTLISKIIKENEVYFKQVGFIGTPYRNNDYPYDN